MMAGNIKVSTEILREVVEYNRKFSASLETEAANIEVECSLYIKVSITIASYDAGTSTIRTTIMDKSVGTLLLFWGVFQFTQVQSLPSPHKQCWTRVSRIFSEIQLCIGWGGGGGGRENCKKISKIMLF